LDFGGFGRPMNPFPYPASAAAEAPATRPLIKGRHRVHSKGKRHQDNKAEDAAEPRHCAEPYPYCDAEHGKPKPKTM